MSSGPTAGGPGGAGFDADMLQRLAAEVHKLPIRDLLVQTIGTISSLAWGRISGENKDLAQAQLAIDALRALIPVVAPTLSEQAGRDLNAVVSSLQLSYVKALGDVAPAPAAPAEPAAPAQPAAPAGDPAPEA